MVCLHFMKGCVQRLVLYSSVTVRLLPTTMFCSAEIMFVLVTFALLAFGCIFSILWYCSIPDHLPPGPLGLPLVGCIPYIEPTTAHLTLETWSKKYGGVMSFYMGSTLVVVLADYEAIREALIKQGDTFNGRSVIRAFRQRGYPEGLGLTGAEGEIWREQRGFCFKSLKDLGAGRSILEPKIRHELYFLLDGIAKSQDRPIDLSTLLHYAVSNIIVQLVFGTRFDYDDPVHISYLEKTTYRLTKSGINGMSTFNFFPSLLYLQSRNPRVRAVLKDTDFVLDFIKRFIREKEARTNDEDEVEDYMSAFLKARKNEEGRYFHEDQLVIAVQQLFIAGSETSATALRWAIWHMAEHPECQEKVHDEIVGAAGTEQPPAWSDHARMPFTEATLCEIMRISNLSPMSITHRTVQETRLLGYRIPCDAYVVPLLWAVHMDPRHFENPKEFKPERFIDCNGHFVKHPACIPFSVAMVQRFRFRFPDGDCNGCSAGGRTCPVVVGVVISPAPFNIIAERRQ